jgi:hypothetical protein
VTYLPHLLFALLIALLFCGFVGVYVEAVFLA